MSTTDRNVLHATERTAFRNWVLGLAATTIATVVCIAWLDRPAAEFFNRHFPQADWRLWIDRLVAPFEAGVLAALAFLLACGAWVISGRRLASWTRMLMLCSWAAMWATAADIILKHVFGRGWVDPTFLGDNLYGFHFLNGSLHWDCFPSGTASISSAVATVLWIVMPRSRWWGVLIVSLLCVGVLITNYHWVGDVVAGVFLGASIGWMTVRLRADEGG